MQKKSMLNDEFLRSIPNALNIGQRILFDSLSFSIESILVNYQETIEILRRYPSSDRIMEIKWSERVSIFSKIWQIIDQCYSMKKLLRKLSKKSDANEDSLCLDNQKEYEKIFVEYDDRANEKGIRYYLEVYDKKISDFRNLMDHLDERIDNIGNTKIQRPPILGALSYAIFNEDFINSRLVYVPVLTIGACTHSKHRFATLNPLDNMEQHIFGPVDLLKFCAIDETLDVTQLYRDTKRLKEVINGSIASHLEKALKSHADENGLSYDEVFEPCANTITMCLTMKLGD